MESSGEMIEEIEQLVIKKWKIRNYLALDKEIDEFFSSPSFSFANASWHLRIYPNGQSRNSSSGFINIYLHIESVEKPISLKFSLGLRTADEKVDPIEECTHEYKIVQGYGSPWTLSKCELLERKHEFAPSGDLTVVCILNNPKPTVVAGITNAVTTECSFCKIDLVPPEDISSHLVKCIEIPIKCQKCIEVVSLKDWYDHKCQMMATEADEKLSNDFKALMLSGDHSDAIIKVKGQEFRLHRNILASRNPYFSSMFTSDMKENITGIVTIDDCEPDVFRSFIHLVYTGKLDKLTSENVCSLYEVADKYQEEQLKKECLQFMVETMTVDTFCDFTSIALKHEEKTLLDEAIKCFASKMKEIIRTVKWQAFLTECPIQANELFIKALV